VLRQILILPAFTVSEPQVALHTVSVVFGPDPGAASRCHRFVLGSVERALLRRTAREDGRLPVE